MSYARWGENSGVYVFTSSRGIECCGCALIGRHWVDDPGSLLGGYLEANNPGEGDPVYRSNTEMIEHLLRHRAAGHLVPEYAFERLRAPEDEKRNQELWAKYDAKEAR